MISLSPKITPKSPKNSIFGKLFGKIPKNQTQLTQSKKAGKPLLLKGYRLFSMLYSVFPKMHFPKFVYVTWQGRLSRFMGKSFSVFVKHKKSAIPCCCRDCGLSLCSKHAKNVYDKTDKTRILFSARGYVHYSHSFSGALLNTFCLAIIAPDALII